MAAGAEALVHAPPPLSTHAQQSASPTQVLQSAEADRPLKVREVSDKPMATKQVRTIAMKDATSQGTTSKSSTNTRQDCC